MLNTMALAALLAVQADDPLRAPCDQAAAHLAAGRAQEACALLEPLAKAAAGPQKARFHYLLGCAAFATGNDLLAGRSLARLAPFDQPLTAAHTRYLLGRLHHRGGEPTEALANYDAVRPAFDKMPADKKNPVPDFVADADFHAGVLLYESKRFADALSRFQALLQKEKRAPLVDEARLRAGLCLVRLKQGAEAVKTLQPLHAHATLARAARWWTARAVLATDGAKPADAVEHFKKAAEAAESPAGPTTAEIQLALGEALGRAARWDEAADAYRKVPAGAQAEAALAGLAAALAAAGKVADAEQAAARFAAEHPASPLAVGVRLSLADAVFAAAQKAPAAQAAPQLEAAVKRYEAVLAEASGPTANAARYRAALALYRQGRIPAALAQLRAIPDLERTGELSAVSALLGECILRSSPPAEDPMDAVRSAALLKDLQEAAAQLEKAMGAGATPELHLKLAGAHRQVATLLADPGERGAAANRARELYEAFRAQHANHPMRPLAEYERANCYALAGDRNTAIQKLERFKGPPFADAPVAPLALLRQGQLYREAGNAQQAAAVLADARAKYEAALLKDPARSGWVPLLRYHHGAALKSANQAAQAVPVLESLVKDFGGSEWAEPARRLLKEAKP